MVWNSQHAVPPISCVYINKLQSWSTSYKLHKHLLKNLMLPVHQLVVLLNNTSYPVFLDPSPSAVLQAANSDSQPPTHSFNQSDSQHASQPTSQPVRLPAPNQVACLSLALAAASDSAPTRRGGSPSVRFWDNWIPIISVWHLLIIDILIILNSVHYSFWQFIRNSDQCFSTFLDTVSNINLLAQHSVFFLSSYPY